MFWRNIDPLVKDKQFCDSGDMYRTGVFYLDDEQKKLAEETKKKVAAKFAPRMVYTEITKADTFYPAEDYHQDYYKKNEARYNFYRWNCGRDQRLEQLWGKKESDRDESTHDVAWLRGDRRGRCGAALERERCGARRQVRDREERRGVAHAC